MELDIPSCITATNGVHPPVEDTRSRTPEAELPIFVDFNSALSTMAGLTIQPSPRSSTPPIPFNGARCRICRAQFIPLHHSLKPTTSKFKQLTWYQHCGSCHKRLDATTDKTCRNLHHTDSSSSLCKDCFQFTFISQQ